MNLADDYIARASAALQQARESFQRIDWALTISRAEESVEYSAKAAIRSVGATYRREHDVSADLLRPEVRALFPSWFQEKIARFRMISVVMVQLRQLARYGDEALEVPARALFTQEEANAYLKDAEEVYYACSRLVSERRLSQSR